MLTDSWPLIFGCLFGLFISVIGGFFSWLLFGLVREAWRTSREAERSLGWPSTRGTVTRSVVTCREGSKLITYAAALRYEYRVGGETYSATRFGFNDGFINETSREHASNNVAARPKGSQVQVYYDPEHPERAVLSRAPPQIVQPLVLAALLSVPTVGMAVAGLVLIRKTLLRPSSASSVESAALGLAAVLLTAAIGVLVAAVVSVYREGGARRWLRSIRRAMPVAPGAAEPGARVLVTGRVEAIEGFTDPLPGDGSVTVFQQITVTHGSTTQRTHSAHTEFWLSDVSGAVLVKPLGGQSLCSRRDVPATAAHDEWLDATLSDTRGVVPAHAEVTIEALCPGDLALVVGQISRDDTTDDYVVQPSVQGPETLLFADGALEEVVERLSRGPRRTNTLAVVGLALVVASLLLAQY